MSEFSLFFEEFDTLRFVGYDAWGISRLPKTKFIYEGCRVRATDWESWTASHTEVWT